MKIRLGTIAIAGLLIAGSSLQATTNTLYLSSSTPAGFTPGPYNGTLNGITVELFCDDAIDTAPIGGSWSVDVTAIADVANPTTDNTRYGAQTTNIAGSTLPTGVALYEELAWLFTQLANPVNRANSSVSQGIQDAAWDLTSNPATNGVPADPDTATWLAAAKNDYNRTSGIANVSVDSTSVAILDPTWGNWMILTDPTAINKPAGGVGKQEFLAYYNTSGSGGHSQPSGTPEPATFGLFGAGLLLGGVFFRRRTPAANSTGV